MWLRLLLAVDPRRLVKGLAGGLVLVGVAALLGVTLLLGAVAGSSAGSQNGAPASCVVDPSPRPPGQDTAPSGGSAAASGGGAAPSGGGTAAPATAARWSATQLANARIIAGRGQAAEVGTAGVIVALMTAMQESSLTNLPGGDRDSVGLFQQRPSAGWGTRAQILDPVRSSDAFYGVAGHTHNPGLLDVPGWERMPFGVTAQAVQRSAYPTLYNRWEPDARALAQWLLSGASGTLDCTGAGGPAQVSGTWAHPLAPAAYTLVSPFGMRFDPVNGHWSMHRGQDLAAPVGTPDRAACDGVVARLDPADPYGGGMQTDLDCGGGVVLKYMHQSAFEVKVGDTVKAGQVIGRTGSTGHSTGPHLHFQVNIDGRATDPVAFMRLRGIRL
jgi:murein DD-endopeptidase MepM/ murein hydrolase activator NlpD